MRKLIAAIAAALSLGSTGCADEQPAKTGPSTATLTGEASVAEAHAQTSRNSVTLIDVRRPNEWQDTGMAEGAIGATLQDSDFLDQILAAVDGDKTRPVALICRSGARSAKAQKMLVEAGYTSVLNVTGGTLEWQKQGLPMQAYASD